MGIEARVALYGELERLRGRPLLVYVTSTRPGASGQISGDAVTELLNQLQVLPEDTKELDLLLVSNGGDPTVAWRVVSLIRERVKKFSVLVPQAAFSAATLIALGADEIVMHSHGNLGPTDPQIHAKRNSGNGPETMAFGSEDLSAFIKYAREQVGLSDQEQLQKIFAKFCDAVGTVAIGVAARSSQLGVVLGERLLRLHMTGETNKQKARGISEKLTRDFFHHGYPLSRSEAKDIGLPIAPQNDDVERMLWQIWMSISEELSLRSVYQHVGELDKHPHRAIFFGPANQQVPESMFISAEYQIVYGLLESSRLASRCVGRGIVTGMKVPQIVMNVTPMQQGWETVWPTAGQQSVPPPKKPRKRGKSK